MKASPNISPNKKIPSSKAIVLLASASALASSMSAMISIETSYVDDIGNPANSYGYGAVDYGYYVGTHEVTNRQYVSFLNAKGSTNAHHIYNHYMNDDVNGGVIRQGQGIEGDPYTYRVKDGMHDMAADHISYWDAVRFANWMTNGQGSGDTESGMYNLTELSSGTESGGTVIRDATVWNAGGVAIVSEAEWVKAAYYQPEEKGGDLDSYWKYPTASNSISTSDANYGQLDHGNRIIKEAGYYSHAPSYYGTFDQGGNLHEWVHLPSNMAGGVRGGSYYAPDFLLSGDDSYNSLPLAPNNESNSIGFRLSSLKPIIVPEPSYAVIFGSLALAVVIMRRKGRCAF